MTVAIIKVNFTEIYVYDITITIKSITQQIFETVRLSLLNYENAISRKQ